MDADGFTQPTTGYRHAGPGPWLFIERIEPRRTLDTVKARRRLLGGTVLILIWARTADDLDTWMPVAETFVRSIDFLPAGQH